MLTMPSLKLQTIVAKAIVLREIGNQCGALNSEKKDRHDVTWSYGGRLWVFWSPSMAFFVGMT